MSSVEALRVMAIGRLKGGNSREYVTEGRLLMDGQHTTRVIRELHSTYS